MTPPEPLIDRRATPRLRIPTTAACLTSSCSVAPGCLRAPCCGRPIITRGYQVTAINIRPTASLGPSPKDFDLLDQVMARWEPA